MFVLGAYLILAGTIRFLIGFVRVNVCVLGIFTMAHLASLMTVGVGVVFLERANRH